MNLTDELAPWLDVPSSRSKRTFVSAQVLSPLPDFESESTTKILKLWLANLQKLEDFS